jgi:hypothetical protein
VTCSFPHGRYYCREDDKKGYLDIRLCSNIKGGGKKMAKKKFNPEDVIGKPYKRGLLPYGGGVTRGKISFAVSEEENLDGLKRLKSIMP